MSRRSFTIGIAGLVALAALGPVGFGASTAHAALPQGVLTATVTTSEVAPFATATTSATTGASTFKRTGKGRYTFTATNLGGLGNVQLTMIDTGERYPLCTVSSQTRNTKGTTVKVRCSENNGTPIDAAFTLFYNTVRVTDVGVGYLALTTATAGNSTPSNQFRSRGTGQATVKRLSRGSYSVTVPGETFTENDGVVMASAVGGNFRYCSPTGWSVNAGATVIGIECRRGTGALTDSNFSLVVTTTTILGTAAGIGASAWSSNGGRDIQSALGPSNAYNSQGGYNSDINGEAGETILQFPGLLAVGGGIIRHVVAYGPYRCGFAPATGSAGNDLVLTVHCKTAAGSPIWTAFDVLAAVQPTVV